MSIMTAKDTYSFTSIPTTLIYLMDNYCLKAMALFIQEESYWKSKGRLENGFFYKPINEISEVLFLQKKQDARRTIEALYRRSLIDVRANNGKKSTMKIRLNWDKIREYANMSIRDIQLFESPIVKLSRAETLTYCQSDDTVFEDELEYKLEPNCPPTIDNKDNKNNIDKKKEEKEETSSSISSALSSSYSVSSSISTSSLDCDMIQEHQSFKPDDNTSSSSQESETDEDKQLDEIIRNITINAQREVNGDKITKDDENFQATITMIMEYSEVDRKEAIEKYNELLHEYKDDIRQYRKTGKITTSQIRDDEPF